MENKKSFSSGVLAGVLLAVVALLRLVNLFQIIRWQFSFPLLLIAASTGFVAAMLLMQRRDKLLIAMGVWAVVYLLWGGLIGFVAVVMMLLCAPVMTTEYLPQAKDLVQKIWFVPAILMLISLVGVRSVLAMLCALVSVAAFVFCGFWLAFPERDIAELFAAAGSKMSAVANGDNSIAEAEVDGYCGLFKQVLLMMVTFGIWYLIWIYRMTRYLNRVGGMEKRDPVKKLLLCIFVPFYLIYWLYQSAQRVDKLAAAVGVESKLSTLCLILAAFLPVAAPILIQDKINTIISVETGSRKADFDPAQKPVVQLTAAPEAVKGYCGLFKHLLLCLLTFGVWYFVWIYRVTAYLNCVEGEEERKPVGKMLLCMFVPFYLFYWICKSCQLIDKLGEQKGVRSNLTALCLILSLVAGFVPFLLMQDKINEIIVAENSEIVPAAVAEAVAEDAE